MMSKLQSHILQHIDLFQTEHQLSGKEYIYLFQANRLLTPYEVKNIKTLMDEFIHTWTSHQEKVYANALILAGYFLVYAIDEQKTSLSGCSKDALTHFIQKVQQQYNVSFLDRYALAFLPQHKIEIIPYQQLAHACTQGLLNKDSLYFDSSIQRYQDLKDKWMIPIKDSWLSNKC